ncbi:unannotated protein [freshwater metagenome]|uniref:Unannotated protein n=1 Tax=freshwater metagenome TaxID=449393 RepID=A0A6J6MN05_9ZZZZ
MAPFDRCPKVQFRSDRLDQPAPDTLPAHLAHAVPWLSRWLEQDRDDPKYGYRRDSCSPTCCAHAQEYPWHSIQQESSPRSEPHPPQHCQDRQPLHVQPWGDSFRKIHGRHWDDRSTKQQSPWRLHTLANAHLEYLTHDPQKHHTSAQLRRTGNGVRQRKYLHR